MLPKPSQSVTSIIRSHANGYLIRSGQVNQIKLFCHSVCAFTLISDSATSLWLPVTCRRGCFEQDRMMCCVYKNDFGHCASTKLASSVCHFIQKPVGWVNTDGHICVPEAGRVISLPLRYCAALLKLCSQVLRGVQPVITVLLSCHKWKIVQEKSQSQVCKPLQRSDYPPRSPRSYV